MGETVRGRVGQGFSEFAMASPLEFVAHLNLRSQCRGQPVGLEREDPFQPPLGAPLLEDRTMGIFLPTGRPFRPLLGWGAGQDWTRQEGCRDVHVRVSPQREVRCRPRLQIAGGSRAGGQDR